MLGWIDELKKLSNHPGKTMYDTGERPWFTLSTIAFEAEALYRTQIWLSHRGGHCRYNLRILLDIGVYILRLGISTFVTFL